MKSIKRNAKKTQKTKKKQYKWQTSIQLYDIFKFDEIKWRRECFTVAPVNNSCQNRNIVQNLNEILHNVKVVSALTIYTLKFIMFLKLACKIIRSSYCQTYGMPHLVLSYNWFIGQVFSYVRCNQSKIWCPFFEACQRKLTNNTVILFLFTLKFFRCKILALSTHIKGVFIHKFVKITFVEMRIILLF